MQGLCPWPRPWPVLLGANVCCAACSFGRRRRLSRQSLSDTSAGGVRERLHRDPWRLAVQSVSVFVCHRSYRRDTQLRRLRRGVHVRQVLRAARRRRRDLSRFRQGATMAKSYREMEAEAYRGCGLERRNMTNLAGRRVGPENHRPRRLADRESFDRLQCRCIDDAHVIGRAVSGEQPAAVVG